MSINTESKCELTFFKRNNNLDILRTFSALMVLAVHTGIVSGYSFPAGAAGVQIFFVLSGYLGIISADRQTHFAYYKGRFRRIIPTYYICLALYWIWDFVRISIENGINVAFVYAFDIRYLRYFALIHQIFPSTDWQRWSNMYGLWTMSSFFLFYIMAPLFSRVLYNFKKSMVFLVFLMLFHDGIVNCIVYMCSFFRLPQEAQIGLFAAYHPVSMLYCFMLGVSLYRAQQEMVETGYALLVSVLLFVLGFGRYKIELAATLVVYICAAGLPVIKNHKIQGIVQSFSRITFPLYLSHWLVLGISQRLIDWLHVHEYVAVCTLLVFVFSILLAYVVNVLSETIMCRYIK